MLASSVNAAELSGRRAQAQLPTCMPQPRFDAPKVATLQRDTAVKISAQQGLWYQLQMPAGRAGLSCASMTCASTYAGAEDGEANLRVLMGGKAGKGRVTETAGVRGIDESDLKSAAFEQAQLNAMVGSSGRCAAAAAYAGEQGWQATERARMPVKPSPARASGKSPADIRGFEDGARRSPWAACSVHSASMSARSSDTAAKVIPKSEDELAAEELALGPEIAGRILGARPLWNDAGAQQRVNLVGRWVASQTSRPELPWTFGVIDTPEVNAFAAPGGFILVTRGLYELLSSDSELAAVLGHEISHCVQRDHYNVIRKQEMATVGKDQAVQQRHRRQRQRRRQLRQALRREDTARPSC